MSYFGGDTTHPMDVKGRLSLASKHRKMLPDDLVLVPSPEEDFPSLWLFSEAAFEEWTERVAEDKGGLLANSSSAQHINREMFRKQVIVTIDSAGRILVPANLRQYASLEKSVRVIGAGKHIEIWNEEILAKSDAFHSNHKILDLP
ncbi:MAG: hypothetical protein FWF91_04070 [Coriobacteriia bacterium]|nr:hypothetical protein [Coriobacteriia bacterium]